MSVTKFNVEYTVRACQPSVNAAAPVTEYLEVPYLTVEAWVGAMKKVGSLVFDDPMFGKLGFVDSNDVWHTLHTHVVTTVTSLSQTDRNFLQTPESRALLLGNRP